MGWRDWYNSQGLEAQEAFDEAAWALDRASGSRVEQLFQQGSFRSQQGDVRYLDDEAIGAAQDYWLTGGRVERPVLRRGTYGVTLGLDQDSSWMSEARAREFADLLLTRWLRLQKGRIRLLGWNPAPGVDYELQVLEPLVLVQGIDAVPIAMSEDDGPGPIVLDETEIVGMPTRTAAFSVGAVAAVVTAALALMVFKQRS